MTHSQAFQASKKLEKLAKLRRSFALILGGLPSGERPSLSFDPLKPKNFRAEGARTSFKEALAAGQAAGEEKQKPRASCSPRMACQRPPQSVRGRKR
ncbi:hypothetical protein [Saccharothrix australiensis]|uniref:hypothetical protein n=1 Tax=Saccharothrix australiensis TaxID=2072 RepID=UPI0011C45F68|nr:hypothetical protein [Saccharothrix australiensis]